MWNEFQCWSFKILQHINLHPSKHFCIELIILSITHTTNPAKSLTFYFENQSNRPSFLYIDDVLIFIWFYEVIFQSKPHIFRSNQNSNHCNTIFFAAKTCSSQSALASRILKKFEIKREVCFEKLWEWESTSTFWIIWRRNIFIDETERSIGLVFPTQKLPTKLICGINDIGVICCNLTFRVSNKVFPLFYDSLDA